MSIDRLSIGGVSVRRLADPWRLPHGDSGILEGKLKARSIMPPPTPPPDDRDAICWLGRQRKTPSLYPLGRQLHYCSWTGSRRGVSLIHNNNIIIYIYTLCTYVLLPNACTPFTVHHNEYIPLYQWFSTNMCEYAGLRKWGRSLSHRNNR